MNTAIIVGRFAIGVFFVMSGLSNYIYFEKFLESVTTMNIALWGLGFDGLGSLPSFLATPYAYILPGLEILCGGLFAFGIFTRWVGYLLIAMLASFVLAFGFFGSEFMAANRASFNKDVIFIIAVWLCIANERKKVRKL